MALHCKTANSCSNSTVKACGSPLDKAASILLRFLPQFLTDGRLHIGDSLRIMILNWSRQKASEAAPFSMNIFSLCFFTLSLRCVPIITHAGPKPEAAGYTLFFFLRDLLLQAFVTSLDAKPGALHRDLFLLESRLMYFSRIADIIITGNDLITCCSVLGHHICRSSLHISLAPYTNDFALNSKGDYLLTSALTNAT